MIKNYNPKIDLLVAKYTCQDVNVNNWPHLRLKSIFKGVLSPKDEYERSLLTIKSCLELIKKQTDLQIEVIDEFNSLLGNEKRYDKALLKEILKIKEEVKVFYELLKQKLFNEKNFEISSLIFNYIRMLKNKIPIAIYQKTKEDILNIINNNVGVIKFQQRINQEILHCLSKNTKHRLVNQELVKKKILDNQESLRKIYGVEKIFLYGSFSYEEATEYSDLDIYIEIREDLKKDIFHKYKIFEFLKKILGLPVDGHVNDIDFDFDSFNDDIKKHLKQIL